jgi:cyclopropane-fatty-acyl-phospholipid synthase
MLMKRRVAELLAQAGIAVNGAAPCDLQVRNEHFYARVVNHGSLGLGEAYMDGWWDVEDLDEFLFRVLDACLDRKVGGLDDA